MVSAVCDHVQIKERSALLVVFSEKSKRVCVKADDV